MQESSIPELLLTPLENVILKAKAFELYEPHIILGLAMDPPKLNDIATTILVLKELGALLSNNNSPVDGDITTLGRMMSNLPIDVRATRLIAIGHGFGVLEDCIIMGELNIFLICIHFAGMKSKKKFKLTFSAACLTVKSIFKVRFERTIDAYSRRLEWSNGSGSDLFAMLNAFKVWQMKFMITREFGDAPHKVEREVEFCRKHYLDIKSLRECNLMVQDLAKRLNDMNIRPLAGQNAIQWTDTEKVIVLKVIISGAFYPNYFATEASNSPMMEHSIYHAMNGRDPNTTVFFSGFRNENIRQLYVKPITEPFRNTVIDDNNFDCIKVSFDKDSEKVFVTFDINKSVDDSNQFDWESKQSTIPGRIISEVYKSVKMRKSRIPFRISVMKYVIDILHLFHLIATKHNYFFIISDQLVKVKWQRIVVLVL